MASIGQGNGEESQGGKTLEELFGQKKHFTSSLIFVTNSWKGVKENVVQ